MKKLLLSVAVFTITAASVNAQETKMKTRTTGGTTFSIAGNVGTGLGKDYHITYGGDIQAEFPATTELKITASAGYQDFHHNYRINNVNYDDISFVPVLAGLKFGLGKGFYGHPQIGYSFLTRKVPGSNQNNGDFSYAGSVGYGFGKNWDLAVKYLSIKKANALVARIAYNF